ncbi:hypothetical protein KUF71_019642, partial [Frankliniella fusca]
MPGPVTARIQWIYPPRARDIEPRIVHVNKLRFAPDLDPLGQPLDITDFVDSQAPLPARALVLLLLAVAAWGKEPTATRGRPVAKMPNNTMLADVSVEQPDGLNAGCIFTQRGDLYFSVSDWLLVLKVQRVDTYMTVVNALINKFAALHDQYVESTSTLHNTVIRDEIGGMLMELTQIKRDLSVFRAYVNNTELPYATVNATVTPPVAVGNATQTNTTAAPSRSKRQVPIPAGIVSNCSMTDPANLCHPANVFLPLWVPSASSPKAADLSHYLSVFYRRISRRIRRDVELNQQRQSVIYKHNYAQAFYNHSSYHYSYGTHHYRSHHVNNNAAAVLYHPPSPLSSSGHSLACVAPRSYFCPSYVNHYHAAIAAGFSPHNSQDVLPCPSSHLYYLLDDHHHYLHYHLSPSPFHFHYLYYDLVPFLSPSDCYCRYVHDYSSPRGFLDFHYNPFTPPSASPSSCGRCPQPSPVAYKRLRDQLAKATKAPLPTTVVPPTVRTVVDDLPDGDTERRLLKEFRDWKMDHTLASLPYGLFLPADFLRDINLTAIPQPVPHHRSRRGVFKSWFGIMDSADRENLQSRFDEMKLKIDGLRVLQDAQTGLANVTLARFLAQDRMIEALKQLEKESFQITIDQQNQYMEYALKMRRMHALIAQVRSEVKTFLTAFHFAELNNMLSPAFVDAEAFSKLLTQLSEQLPPGIQLPVLPTPDRIDYYFRVARASAVVTTDAMHLHVHLPLVFTTRKYKLYEITPFPRKLNNSDIYSFYSTDTKYIAVDEPQKTHVLLTDADLRSCHDHPETPICSPAVPVHEEEDTCAIALLLSDKAKIDTLCEPYLHFVKNPPPTFVSYRAGHTWAFSVPEKTKLVLTDTQGRHLQSNVTMLPQTGILHLPAFTIAKALGVALYSGSTFVSHEDLSGSLILPDIPSVELPQLALNNTNRHIIIEQLDVLFNKSAQLGLDGALRLQEIKAALELPWFRDWHTHALAYSRDASGTGRPHPRDFGSVLHSQAPRWIRNTCPSASRLLKAAMLQILRKS